MAETGLSDATAVILAGGLGTRLRAVVADRPKVLAPVNGRPFLSYLLDQLAEAHVREVFLLTGYQGGQVEQEFGRTYHQMKLRYSAEKEPLGTAGALRAALPCICRPTVLLLNGDSYCRMEMRSFADLHRQRRADVSLAITWVPDSTRYGQVVVREDDHVYRFAEKQTSHSGGRSGWINAGIYLLNRNLVEEIPTGQAVSLERDMLPRWVTPGSTRNVFAYRCRGPFLDIGTAESYVRAGSFFNGLLGGAARESMPTRDCVPARQTRLPGQRDPARLGSAGELS